MATRKPSNDELHYASLISLFKYTVSILGVIGTLFAFGIGWITYSDGKEMRAELKEQRRQMKEEVKEMKSELKEARGVMQTQAEDLKQNTLISMDQTKRDALSQISGVKENSTLIAQTQAKKSIDAVFDVNNIDQFIIKVAKDRMEPQVKSLVDGAVADLKTKRKFQIIDDIKTNDHSLITKALNNLKLYPDIEFNEDEINTIFQIIYSDKDPESRWTLARLFIYRPSNTVTKYFLKDLKDDLFITEQFNYFVINSNERKHLIDVCKHIMSTSDGKTTTALSSYVELIRSASIERPDVALMLLNNNELVSNIRNKFVYNDIERAHVVIKDYAKMYGFTDKVENTLFFKLTK